MDAFAQLPGDLGYGRAVRGVPWGRLAGLRVSCYPPRGGLRGRSPAGTRARGGGRCGVP
jgi:hypothetical protein